MKNIFENRLSDTSSPRTSAQKRLEEMRVEEALVAFPELRHDNTTIHTLLEYIGRLVGKTTERLALLQNFEAEQTELRAENKGLLNQIESFMHSTLSGLDRAHANDRELKLLHVGTQQRIQQVERLV